MKMVRVFVSGSFDMLHSGHITFLKEASKYGDLYVGIGSDYSIKKYKGKNPVCTQKERLFMVKAIRYVKDAMINKGEGPVDFLFTMAKFNPDILIVNKDQASVKKELLCLQYGIEYLVLKRTKEPGLPKRSTTKYRKLL
jgi:cytidyltransferase-like protein